MDWEKLRDKLVREKYPDEKEFQELRNQYENISKYIETKYGVETFFAGSAGRKTCMKGDRDIDLFLMFPEDLKRQKLESQGLNIGEKVFKHFAGDYEVEYAEHPYTKGGIEGHEVEIVPCYDTNPGEIKSAVDRSPHHAKWVRENLSEEQKQDVVLLKTFLKAQGVYGSSLKIQGFSGYLCEILVHYFGSFKNLLEEAENWSEKEIIDPEKHHEGELPEELEKKFSDDSLVVIDPVDEERNVASVLTTENYSKFIYDAWRFNRKPGMNFFRVEETEVTKFEIQREIEKRGDFLVIELDSINEPDDIVYPQMRKTMSRLEKKISGNDFRIFESGFHVGENIRLFFELNSILPETEYVKGPRIFHGLDHLEQFNSKYSNTFIRGDRIVAKIDREFTEVKELLKNFLDGDRDELEEKGIPGNVARKIQDFRMVDPVMEDEAWLKFLAEKLKVEQ